MADDPAIPARYTSDYRAAHGQYYPNGVLVRLLIEELGRAEAKLQQYDLVKRADAVDVLARHAAFEGYEAERIAELQTVLEQTRSK